MSKRNFVAPCGKGFAQQNSLSRHQPVCEKCQEILKANVPPPGDPSPPQSLPSTPTMPVSPNLEAARAETDSKITAMEGRIAERMTQLEQGMAQAIIASANTIETKIGSRVSEQLGQLIPQAVEGWLKANIPMPNKPAENAQGATQAAPAQTQAVIQPTANGQQPNLQSLVFGLLQVADSSPTLQMVVRLVEKKLMGGGRAGVGSKDWWDGALWVARSAKTKQKLEAVERLGDSLGYKPSATVAAITEPAPAAPKPQEVKP